MYGDDTHGLQSWHAGRYAQGGLSDQPSSATSGGVMTHRHRGGGSPLFSKG